MSDPQPPPDGIGLTNEATGENPQRPEAPDGPQAGGQRPDAQRAEQPGLPAQEAGAQPEKTVMTPQQLIPMLAEMEPQQREEFLAQPGIELTDDEKSAYFQAAEDFKDTGKFPQQPDTESPEAAAALEQERAEARRKWEEAMVLSDEGKTKEAARKLEIPDNVFDTFKYTHEQIGEEERLTSQMEQNIVDRWTQMGMPNTADAVDTFIQMIDPQLNDTDRERLVNRLRAVPVKQGEEQERAGKEPSPKELAGMEAQKVEAEAMLNGAETTVNKRLEGEQNPEEIKKLARYQKQIGGLKAKMQDLFAEGTTGRKVAQKGGKMLYWAFLTAIVLLLLQMNLIYSASRRQGRGG